MYPCSHRRVRVIHDEGKTLCASGRFCPGQGGETSRPSQEKSDGIASPFAKAGLEISNDMINLLGVGFVFQMIDGGTVRGC